MVRLYQATLIGLASTVGILFLWLERLYTADPLTGIFSPVVGEPILIKISFVIAGLTTPLTFIIMAIGGALIAVYEHHAKLWWLAAATFTTTLAATLLLKEITALPRPSYALLELSSYGFPSLHAAMATVGLFAIIYSLHLWQTTTAHGLIIACTIGAWLLICFSRLTLGVHGLSDVLAGILLGIITVSFAISLAPRLLNIYDSNK